MTTRYRVYFVENWDLRSNRNFGSFSLSLCDDGMLVKSLRKPACFLSRLD